MQETNKKFKLVSNKKTRTILPNMFTLVGVCIGLTSIKFAFDERFGDGEKFYIDMESDSKEYYRWDNGDKIIHLDFDGLNIDIVVNSTHFNTLSRKSNEKDSKNNLKKKADRIDSQIKKLF